MEQNRKTPPAGAWKNGSNRLLGKTIGRTLLPCFLLALTYNLGGLADSLLSGVFFSPMHIAAIGVALPINLLFTAILDVPVQGTYSLYTSTLGRGQRRKSREIFTVGLLYIVTLGLLFSAFVFAFAFPLVRLFGAATDELQSLAAQYLRFTALVYPFVGITKLLTLILGIYGCQRETFAANLVQLISNIAFSSVLVLFVPQIGFGALGLGTLASMIPALAVCFAAAKRRKIPIEPKMRLAGLRFGRFVEMVSGGIAGSLNAIIDGLMAGVINRIIVSSALGTTGLAVYSVVFCFWQLSRVSAEGTDYAAGSMLGVCYACRDKGGLKAIFAKTVRIGLTFSVVWALLIFAGTPFLLKIYLLAGEGAGDITAPVRLGILLTLAFAPAFTLNYLLTSFFDITEDLKTSIAFAVLPDSVLYPLLLLLLLPRFGYVGIWLALGGNTAVFLLMYLLFFGVRKKHRPASDEFLRLDRGKCADYPAIDVTVRYSDEDVSDLAERIQFFLKKEGAGAKTAYLLALCADELTTDIIAHSRSAAAVSDPESAIMDLKIISEKDAFRVILCNMETPYNPLDFDYSEDDFSKIGLMMVQRIAEKIDYNYINRMNMIVIQVKK